MEKMLPELMRRTESLIRTMQDNAAGAGLLVAVLALCVAFAAVVRP